MTTIQFIFAHYQEILVAIIGIIAAIIGLMNAVIYIALMIPGPQPEAFLQKAVDVFQKAVDFLTKFSKKKE